MTMTTNNAATIENTVVETSLVPVRDAVCTEIKSLLETIGTSYIKIGSLLNEARPDFEKQADFLQWVNDEFSIKKAQTYNLMKVAQAFEDDKRFTGVAMRVMLALVDHVDNEEVMGKAAELAAEGDLSTATLNALIAPAKPAKAATAPQVEHETAPQTLQEVPADEGTPWDEESEETQAAPVAPQEAQEPTLTPAPVPQKDADSERVAGLLSLVETLKATNQALADEIAAMRSERTSKKAAAPMLPHFKHKSFPVRLGLTDEEASKKTAVNKAKRELVKAGYGEGHEAWTYIAEAVEALTK